jgi:hypothetical protein
MMLRHSRLSGPSILPVVVASLPLGPVSRARRRTARVLLMAAKPGKTSPVLVVFLIFFILATLILGVTTYLGFNGQTELAAATKKADEENAKRKNDADWFQFLSDTLMAYEGHELTPKEKENIGPLRKGFEGGTLLQNSRDPDKDAKAKIVRDILDKEKGWDGNQNRAVKTYKGELEDAKKQLDDAIANWKKSQNDEKDSRDKSASLEAELKKAQDNYRDALTKAKDEADKELAKQLAKVAALSKDLEEMSKSKEDLRTEAAQTKADYEKQIARLKKDIAQLMVRVNKAEEKNAVVSLLDYDHPKGHVIRIDPTGRMVYIDLGSADNLKSGITFSVYGVGADGKPIAHDVLGSDGKPILGTDLRPEKEGKATLEVANVLGEHVAQARVTWLRDEGADPILRGDVLFNPGWDPKARQHVAVTGLVDLTGEGRDNTAEFVRQLQRQGVIIDAYLDMKDISVKGKGIDRQTDYLILGFVPDFQGSETAKDDDPRAKRRQAIVKEMEDMKAKAVENGVTLISLRKFMVMSGYPVPAGVGIETPASSARPAALSGGGAKPGADK